MLRRLIGAMGRAARLKAHLLDVVVERRVPLVDVAGAQQEPCALRAISLVEPLPVSKIAVVGETLVHGENPCVVVRLALLVPLHQQALLVEAQVVAAAVA